MLTVTINPDIDCDCPCDFDGWQLYSFNRRHINFRHPDDLDIDGIGMRRKLSVGTAFRLSYHEHGLCRWDVGLGAYQNRWDSVSFAGLLVWEQPPSHLGPKTFEDRQRDARSFCEVYTSWANGDCWYYSIEDANGDHVDSCGGFYGCDVEHMFAVIRDAIDGRPFEVVGDGQWLTDYHEV